MGSFEERLQARLDAYEAAPATRPTRRPADPEVVEPDRPNARPHPPGGWPELDELTRQVKVLRNQLKGALEEVDRRLEEAATRLEKAERRAARASAQADAAIEVLNRLADARSAVAAEPAAPDDQQQRLREALTQIRAGSATRH